MKKIIIILVATIFLTGGMLVASQNKLPLVGSIKSDKYHYSTCRYAEKIAQRYLIVFYSAQDAIRKGYAPCKVCKPPTK